MSLTPASNVHFHPREARAAPSHTHTTKIVCNVLVSQEAPEKERDTHKQELLRVRVLMFVVLPLLLLHHHRSSLLYHHLLQFVPVPTHALPATSSLDRATVTTMETPRASHRPLLLLHRFSPNLSPPNTLVLVRAAKQERPERAREDPREDLSDVSVLTQFLNRFHFPTLFLSRFPTLFLSRFLFQHPSRSQLLTASQLL